MSCQPEVWQVVDSGGESGPAVSRTIDRSGALSLLLGGPALALAYLLRPPQASPSTVASGLWILVQVLFMVSLLGGVFGPMALLSRYLGRGGRRLGLAGFGMGVIRAEVFNFPVLAVEFPEVVQTYGDGTMMSPVSFAFPPTRVVFALGFLVFSHELRRTGTSSLLACGLTMPGVLVFGVGLRGLVPMMVARLGAALFGAGVVALGWGLLGAVGPADPGRAGLASRRP